MIYELFWALGGLLLAFLGFNSTYIVKYCIGGSLGSSLTQRGSFLLMPVRSSLMWFLSTLSIYAMPNWVATSFLMMMFWGRVILLPLEAFVFIVILSELSHHIVNFIYSYSIASIIVFPICVTNFILSIWLVILAFTSNDISVGAASLLSMLCTILVIMTVITFMVGGGIVESSSFCLFCTWVAYCAFQDYLFYNHKIQSHDFIHTIVSTIMILFTLGSIPIIYYLDKENPSTEQGKPIAAYMWNMARTSRFLLPSSIVPFSFVLIEISGYQQSDGGIMRAIECVVACVFYGIFLRTKKLKEE